MRSTVLKIALALLVVGALVGGTCVAVGDGCHDDSIYHVYHYYP